MSTRMLSLAVALVGGLGMATAATATPFGGAFEDEFDGPRVERVADGCGPGWHANPWGRCRPNRWEDRDGYGPPRGYGPPPPRYRDGYDRDWDRPPPPRPRPRSYDWY